MDKQLSTTTVSFLPYQNQQNFSIELKSNVSALIINTTNAELSFTVSGPSGTIGYVKATMPKTLLDMEGTWVVSVNNQSAIPKVNENVKKQVPSLTNTAIEL